MSKEMNSSLWSWIQKITTAKDMEENKFWLVNFKEGCDFYKGIQCSEADFPSQPHAGEYPLITVNRFARLVDHILNSVYSEDPKICVEPRGSFKNAPNSIGICTILIQLLSLTWARTDIANKIVTAFMTSFFANTAWVKLEPDELRGLWTISTIHQVIVDPTAESELSKARWVCHRCTLPVYQVLNEYSGMFRPEAVTKLKEIAERPLSYTDANSSTFGKTTQDIDLYYIYTNEGKDPHHPSEDDNKVRLMVYCNEVDEWLMDVEDPSPYLMADEFPLSFIRLMPLPGKFVGTAPWRRVADLCRAYNSSATHLLNDIKTTSQRIIGFDQSKVLNIDNFLNSKEHNIAVPIQGPPEGSVAPLNIGQNDKNLMPALQWNSFEIDSQFNVYDIARGEGGKDKTATESQILAAQANVSLRSFIRAMDDFLNDIVDKLGRAMLYYIPAYSVYRKPHPEVPGAVEYYTQAMVPTPVPDPMTGQIMMQPTLQEVVSPVKQEIKGIDILIGKDEAAIWPTEQKDLISDDIEFKIEAGSHFYTRRMEKRQLIEKRFETMGPILQQMGDWNGYYDLLEKYDQVMADGEKSLLMPKEAFIQLMVQKMMAPPSAGPGIEQPDVNAGQFSTKPPTPSGPGAQ